MIELRNVVKTHHRGETEVRALRGITCNIPTESFTFLVGPSGSGKSTLLYLIGTLDSPTSGEIIVNGQNLSTMTNRERDRYRQRQVGFIFQSFNLLGNLNALDNVLVPFMPSGITADLRKQAAELLDRVGLSQRMKHRPNQLSGGEQQRIAIARALLKRPELILADEPTGELDTATGEEVFGYLRQLHRERKTTVLVVTHDARYIRPDDAVLRMRDGMIEPGDFPQNRAAPHEQPLARL